MIRTQSNIIQQAFLSWCLASWSWVFTLFYNLLWESSRLICFCLNLDGHLTLKVWDVSPNCGPLCWKWCISSQQGIYGLWFFRPHFKKTNKLNNSCQSRGFFHVPFQFTKPTTGQVTVVMVLAATCLGCLGPMNCSRCFCHQRWWMKYYPNIPKQSRKLVFTGYLDPFEVPSKFAFMYL